MTIAKHSSSNRGTFRASGLIWVRMRGVADRASSRSDKWTYSSTKNTSFSMTKTASSLMGAKSAIRMELTQVIGASTLLSSSLRPKTKSLWPRRKKWISYRIESCKRLQRWRRQGDSSRSWTVERSSNSLQCSNCSSQAKSTYAWESRHRWSLHPAWWLRAQSWPKLRNQFRYHSWSLTSSNIRKSHRSIRP